MRLLLALITSFYLCLSGGLVAQENGRTILVLDASGSMWGQIDGRAKITIAQDVIDGLLTTIPADQTLGLTAYGHRRKGDCTDIETLVEPGEGTRNAISSAVNAIKPKGKTPLSAAVIAAAEALKYTEEKATVILVSDGRETCDFDPCEVGKALEEAGVDFTAHVVGFDVAKPADRAQLQCLAENTGGVFHTASNAAELTEALKVVAVPPAPVERRVRFQAIEGENGPRITEGLMWSLTNIDTGELVLENVAAAALDQLLLPGNYRADVLRIGNESNAELTVRVSKNTDTTFSLILPLIIPSATLTAPATGIAGATLDVNWTGPDDENDFIAISKKDERDSKWIHYTYTRDGAPLVLQLPAVPGIYEVKYVHGKRRLALARQDVEVLPVQATIDAPDQAYAGQTLAIDWTGPDYRADYLATAEGDAPDNKYLTYSYTSKGAPLGLVMPSEPGTYEVRYIVNQGNTVIARKSIEVLPVTANLKAPDTASAGDTIVVEWDGPDYQSDYITVAKADARGQDYANYAYTGNGNPTRLLMPVDPGEYEIRYVMSQNATILARRTISVADITASLEFKALANIGEPVLINWRGPDYDNDYISVGEVGARPTKYLSYNYTANGSPLRLPMPLKPGKYEVRYIQSQGATVLASQLVEVVDLTVTLDVPKTANIGEALLVAWDGPNYERDYIAISEIGSRDTKYVHYTYTQHGTPLRVQMPAKPGEYEIRYMANGSPDTKLASQNITVNPVIAELSAPSAGSAGGTLLVNWAGPDNKRDYIAVAAKGGKRYKTYRYTSEGSPLRIELPEQPGEYEIWYVLNVNDTVIGRKDLLIE